MNKSKKSYEWSSTLVLLLAGLLALYGLFLFLKRKWSTKTVEQEPEGPEVTDEADTPEEERIVENYKLILNTFKQNGIENLPFIQLVTAQAMHETGWFTSDLMHDNYNYFGMRQPSVRDTVSEGAKDGYASYGSLGESVVDYLLWTRYVELPTEYTNTDRESIILFNSNLKSKGYYEDKPLNYQNGLSVALKKLKTLIVAG